MWSMSWNSLLKTLSLLLTIMVLIGCQSNSADYTDQRSDPTMLKKIEQQYQTWRKTPYRYGSNSLKGTDCSGLAKDFYHNKLNTPIPRVTSQQAEIGKDVSHLIAGDLVFFKTGRGQTGLHVGIYYKDGLFLHVSTSKGVQYSSLRDSYWQERYWQARRVIN